jgi:hypothetical protein
MSWRQEHVCEDGITCTPPARNRLQVSARVHQSTCLISVGHFGHNRADHALRCAGINLCAKNHARMLVIGAISEGLRKAGATYTLPPMKAGAGDHTCPVYPVPANDDLDVNQVLHSHPSASEISLQQAAAANMVLLA